MSDPVTLPVLEFHQTRAEDFSHSSIIIGFSILIALMNHLNAAIPDSHQLEEFLFSSV